MPTPPRKPLDQSAKNKVAKNPRGAPKGPQKNAAKRQEIITQIVDEGLTPAIYNRNVTQEHLEIVVIRVAGGDNVANVCKELGVSSGQVYQRAIDDPEFGRRLKIAREVGTHTQVDQMLSIAGNDKEAVERSRLKIDVIKWLASRLGRNDYGDKPLISAQSLNIILSPGDTDLC